VSRGQLQQAAVGLHRRPQVAQLLLAQVAEPRQQLHGVLGVGGQLQLALQVVHQLDVLPLGGEQPVQRAQRRHRLGVVAHHLFPGHDGLVEVADHLLLDGGDADVDGLALLGVQGEDGLLAQGIDQVRPALGAGVQALEGHQGRGVLRLDLLGLAEVLHRLVRLPELLVIRDGHHQQELALQRGVQLLVGVGVGVQGHQLVPLDQGAGQVLEGQARVLRGGVLPEGAGVGGEGLLGPPERGLQLPDAQEQRHPPGGGLLLAEADALGLDQARQVLLRLVDRLQRRHRLGLPLLVAEEPLQRLAGGDVGGVQLQRLLVGGDGPVDVVAVLLAQLPQTELQLGRGRAVRRQLQLPLQGARQVLPALRHPVEAVERAQRGHLLGRLLEDVAVEGDGLVWVADLLLVQGGQLEADLALLLGGVGQGQLLVVDGQQVGVALGGDVQPLQRQHRVLVVGVQLEDGPVAGDGRLGVSELVLVGAGQGGQERQRRPRILGRHVPHRRLVGLHQRRPAVGLAGQPLRVGARPLPHRVLGEGLQRDLRRRRLVVHLAVEELGDAQHPRLALGRDGGVHELHLQHPGQPAGVLALLVERDEGLGRRQVGGVEGQRLLERLAGPVGLPHPVPVELPDLVPEADPAGVVLGLRLPLQHPDELVPLPLRGVEPLQRVPVPVLQVQLAQGILGAAVVRLRLQQRPPGRDGPGEVLELLGVEQRHLGQEAAQLGVGGLSGLTLEHRGQVPPHLLALVELLQLGQGVDVVGLVGEDLLPQVDADGGLLQLLGGQLGHLAPAPPPLVPVGDPRDLLAVDGHQLVPVAPLLVHLLEVGERLGVGGLELEDGLEGLDRLGLVGELLQVEVGHLEVERDLLLGGLDHRRLLAQERDQLRPAGHGLVLAGQRVDGLQVVGLDGEDLVEGVDHHHVELEAVAVELDHLEQHRDLQLGRGEARLLHPLLEDLDAGLPALGLLVHAGQLAPGRPGGRQHGDDLLPGVDRFFY
jgi:hypothetical protein